MFSEGSGTYWNTNNNSSSGSALSYIPEVVWNDTASEGDLASTGGGKSTIFGRPTWQTGTGVPDGDFRAVPDVSFTASGSHDGYLVCSQGSCVNGYRDAGSYLTVFGGTSAGAPVFAGILALINQQIGTAQGNVNPMLYSLATSLPSAFHDITSGDNKVPCTTGTTDCASGGSIGYSAGTGYDLATGLGSVDSFVLASAWAVATAGSPNFELGASSSSLTIGSGTPETATITATALNGFNGAITWSCAVSSALSSSATCLIAADSSTPNAKATLTVSALRQNASVRTPANTRSVLWLVASGLPFCLVFLTRRPQKTSRLAAVRITLFTLFVTMTVAGAIGCGGGGHTTATVSSSSTPVTGTVQAVSGTTSHTLSLTATVQ